MSRIKYVPPVGKSKQWEKKSRNQILPHFPPYKLCGSPDQHVGYKGGFHRNVFTNLVPKTKYCILVPLTDKQPGNIAARQFYNITPFCRPKGQSKRWNNKNYLSYVTPEPKRTNLRYWWADHFVSSPEGKLEIEIFKHAYFRYGIKRVTDWNRTWLQDWRENALKRNIIIVPFSQVIFGPTTLDPVTLKIQAPPSIITCPPPPWPGPPVKSSQELLPDYIQTFFLDPNAFKNTKSADITSISVYFLNKPDRKNNRCGILDPSITCVLLDVENDTPVLKEQYTSSMTNLPYTSVISTSDATAPTTFNFQDPIRVEVGKKYAFALMMDDELFIPWTCKTGDRILGTNTPSPGASKDFRGDLYTLDNVQETINNSNFSKGFSKKDDTDLKFDIEFADYIIDTDLTLKVTNKNEEFLTLENISTDFFNGETVYIDAANSTGTVSITGGEEKLIGSGTSFTSLNEDEVIILIDSTDNTIVEAVQIDSIVSDTVIELSEPVENTISGNFVRATTAQIESYFEGIKRIILTDSTANATNYFTTSSVLVGVDSGATANVASLDNFPISVFSCDIDVDMPTTFTCTGEYNFARSDGLGSYEMVSSTERELSLTTPNHVRHYQALILSRSTEIVELSGAKSANIHLTFSYNGPENSTTFECPYLNVDEITFSTSRWLINNDDANEHTNYGSSSTKHISKPLSFEEGNSAEDIRVIYNAWRPETTDVLCYAKIINSNDPAEFDSKSWTLLEMKRGNGQFGAKDDPGDYREYEFGFPDYPPSSETLDGTVDTETENSNNIVVGSGTTFDADIANNDIIKIYNPLFPDTNYGVFSVDSVANNTQIVLTSQVANVNITGTGLKIDKLSTPYTAFNNADNLNIVRYFGEEGEIYDTYSTVIIKTVLVADGYEVVPKVADYRVIGVSS